MENESYKICEGENLLISLLCPQYLEPLAH